MSGTNILVIPYIPSSIIKYTLPSLKSIVDGLIMELVLLLESLLEVQDQNQAREEEV